MALAVLKGVIHAVKRDPVVTFQYVNSVYGFGYGMRNCEWSEPPLVVERVACGALMTFAHQHPASWWTTYWHLATYECRFRGRDAKVIKDHQPFRCILDLPSIWKQ